ncbi:MAG: thymidine phosphorylase [Coriobacteriia bacterium]|nr:thymidine phosphorylase [Coriobacteriia bacterium]
MDASFEELIERKRDGGEHSAEEIAAIVAGFVAGDVPDYQMSAWLMAVLLRGLSRPETIAMTDAMVRSGRRVDLSAIPGVKVDKHSTGGVADTTTLVLAPLVASCGVPVAKMSGRGLSFTGGTLDKLESVPGLRTALSVEEMIAQVRRIGVAVVAQTADIDPADRLIYALRDVTGTVPSIPLIVSSIVSKKIAGGADAILVDVKVGSGAFMKTRKDALCLAEELTAVGTALGRRIECVLSDMDAPLGMAVGNAIEVAEAIRTLRGEGPAELTELCLALGSRLLVMGEVAADEGAARAMLIDAIASGRAIERFRLWVEAQGGDPRVAEDPSLLPQAAFMREVRVETAGRVTRLDAEQIGRAAAALGAGRQRIGDTVDPAAGLVLDVRVGDRIVAGSVVGRLYASEESLLDAAEKRFREAVRVGAA